LMARSAFETPERNRIQIVEVLIDDHRFFHR
jgi:hypothetical protein